MFEVESTSLLISFLEPCRPSSGVPVGLAMGGLSALVWSAAVGLSCSWQAYWTYLPSTNDTIAWYEIECKRPRVHDHG